MKKFVLSIAAAFTCTIAAINCAPAQTEPTSEVYYALLKHDGEAWCGFSTAVQFQSEATANPPFETARLTYANEQLTEVLYQFDAESGDWVVVDQYLPGSESVRLRRTSRVLYSGGTEVVQEAQIRDGRVGAFSIAGVATLDGQALTGDDADLSEVYLPNVPVIADLTQAPLVRLIARMRSQSAAMLCDAATE